MDVLMPDGTTITGVPEGITQSELLARYGKYTASNTQKTGIASLAKPEQAYDPLGQVIGDIPKPLEYDVEGKGKMGEPGAFTTLTDLAKQFIAPIAKAPFALPQATETAAKGFVRQAMEQPESSMTSAVQPGLVRFLSPMLMQQRDNLLGPKTEEERIKKQLEIQRTIASIPSIPGAKALNKIGEDVQKDILGSLSPEAKKALEESQITGNIFEGEVDFGTNPNAYGYALQAANVFGSMAPVIATAMVTKSPGVGGYVGGTMAADEAATNAAEYINKMPDAELLQKSPFYAQMISGGASPKEARELTIKKAAESGAALQGLVATFGGVLTGKLVTGAFDKVISKLGTSRIARGAGTGTVSGLEEALQETGEGLASDITLKNVIPSKELGEDSAGNALLGFIGGAGPGAAKGVLSRGEAREPEGGLAELMARQRGFLRPEGAPRRQTPVAEPVAKPITPPSASQDTDSMLREALGELINTVNISAPKEPEAENPTFDATGWTKSEKTINKKTGELNIPEGVERYTKEDEDGTSRRVITRNGEVSQSETTTPTIELTNSVFGDEGETISGRIKANDLNGTLYFFRDDNGQIIKMSPRASQQYKEGVPVNKIAELEFSDAGGIRPDGTKTPHTTTSVLVGAKPKPAAVEAPPSEQPPSTQLVNEVIPDTNTVSVADQTQLPGRMTVEVPVGQLQLSEDVPQFKTDANKEGIVEPLGGKFERTGVAPIQVWRREDGRMEVISGRHRFDLAKRSGEETIPAQIHDEKAGFTKDMAAVLDAELNIRDGQGKVKDYVNYFKGTGLDQDTAESRGLLARSPGKRAFTIANQGSDELIAGVRSDKVGDEAAYLIALNAPNDSRLQGVGIKAIQEGKSSSNAVNLMQAVKALASEADTTTDMFGFDDSAMKEAEDMAKIAASKQREVQTRLSAITGAAKNPAVAKAEGIDVRDPEAVKRRINELRQLKTSWDNWSTNPNLISEIRTARGAPVPELQLRGETEAEIRQREATQERDKAAAEQKAIADREVDMFKLQPQVAERGEAPTMDMFGAADMANQPAQTKQAPELTEGLFAQKPKTEQERIASMPKKQFREDKETRGKTDHPALKMVFKGQTPKGLIEKYGEKDVRFLGRLFDIDVKDKFNVAKKLIAINSGLDLVRGKTKDDFDKMNKEMLGGYLEAIGQSKFGRKYEMVDRLLKHEDNIMGKFNDNLQDLKHKAAILNEARAGKPVSEEVLKDYPDVAAYTLPRGSDGYKDAVHRLAIKYLPTHGMDTPSVINSFREDAKNTNDALEKNVANDIADDMEKYYQSQQKKSNETMAKLGAGTGPTMSEMIAENKRVKAELAALEKAEKGPLIEAEKEAAEEAAEEEIRNKAESEIDEGPIGQAIAKIENGDIETKAQIRTFIKKLERDGTLDDVEDVREGLSDREQDASEVLDTLSGLLDDARDNAIDERVDELLEERAQEEQVVRAQTKEMAEAEKPKKAPKKKVTTSKTKEAPLSLEYTKALDESREATKEFSKAQEAYRAQEIDDDEFLIARKKYDLATAQFDRAFKQEQNRPAQEVADEVLPAEEPEVAGELENEPYTFEGEFTEIGDEEQRTLITDQSSKLSDAQINTLEQEYGAKNGSDEFFEALRKDVIAYVTQGAKAVSGKIRAIIRQMANGLLSVAIVFNPQFVSQPYTIAVPQYDVRTSEVVKELPKEAQSMSDAAKRAYGVIYPTLEAQLKADNKLFIVADKQSGNTYMFQPDGSLLLQSKTLFGAGIGDFMKGDNNIVANRITPAGLFDLGLRDAQRSEGEARTAGEYDFGKVFVLDKSYMGRNGPYSNTIMHSVWTNETDAKKRLAALDKPGAEDSRYSFGCINVNKETFRNLITNHLSQMDGAKIFIVPENGTNVMDFVNGKATYSEDIIRQRVTPVTKTTKTEKQRAAPKSEERTMVAKEEEPGQFTSLEPQTKTPGREQQFFSLKKQTSTPAFKKFFGDSKVVDANGEPLVVYHGTGSDILVFDESKQDLRDAGFWFGSSKDAGGYAYREDGGNIMPVYLRINNPKIYYNRDVKITPELIKQLKAQGYDGIKRDFANGPDAWRYGKDAQPEWAVFNNTQIKSATGNRGTYDESGNINESIEDDIVKLVNDTADSIDETEKKRSPSFKRKAKVLTNQRNEGKITDEEYLDRMNAAIAEDEENRLGVDRKDRVRGADFIREKLLNAKRNGFLSDEAVDLAEWFIGQNPALVDDLGISIKGKGPEGAGGFYNAMARIMTLIKEGGSDLTTVHEILHHLERMMPAKIQAAIRKAWLTQLLKANKAAKDPAQKLYFMALLDAHIGNNNHTRLEIPKGSEGIYKAIVEQMKFANELSGGIGADPKSSALARELLLYSPTVPSELYEYFDPSEFWAVNGSDIVRARYDAVKGGVLARLKNWLREFAEKVKSLFGMKSDASIIRALDSLAKSDGKFVTDEMLGTGDYQNISKNFRGGEMPEATWAMKESNNFDDWLYTWQDNYRDLKNVQKIITEQIGKIDDRLNAYRKETLNPGREAEQAQEFLKYEVDPLVKEMRKDNVSNQELAKYLHNRYAEERNEIINAKNKSPAVQDQGSGISTEKAREYLSNLPADRKQVLENLANQIDKIVRGTQDILVTSGQETQDTIDGWRSESPHYVPLNRDESELDFIVQTGGGNLGGYATAGKFGKEALGSTKTVVNILENVMLQRDRAIRRAESIRIGQALYGMAIKYPNPDFWMAINPDAIKDMDALVAEMEGMGLDPELIENLLEQPKTAFVSKTAGAEGETVRDVKYRVNRSYQNARNVFPIRINGQNRFVLFNPKSPEAMRLAAELKQLNAEKLGVFFGAASTFSRWFAAVNSQYNPAFGLVNIFNDTQGALVNLSTTPLAGQQAQVLKDVLPAIRGIARDIRKERKQTTKTPIKTSYNVDNLKPEDWTALWRLFRQTGGKTGFRDQMVRQRMNVQWKGFVPSFSFEDEHVMLRAMEKLERGPIRQKVEWWADAFSDFNDTLENTVRLATFKVAYLDNKLSAEEAADIAKNITVNFNKRGARTKHVRGLYAFFNASLQGTARYAITLSGKAGPVIIKTGLAMGALNAMWMFLAGFDDDDPPQFTKNKGFVIPTFDGDYFIWNLPPGLRAIPNTGRLITEGMLISLGLMKSNRGMAGKISDVGSVIVDAVNPYGGGTFMQTIAPTFLDPAVALAENKDSFGRPIFKEDQSLKPKPGWQRTRETASAFSKELSYFLNYVSSGGEEFSKGFLSPTGDQLDYLIGQAAGGIGRELKRTGELIANKITGEETPAYRVPLANRFFGETKTDAATSARFYDNVTMLAGHLNVLNGRIENKGDVQGYFKENPVSKLAFASQEFENDISSLNKDIADLQKLDETPERKAQIKNLKETKIKIMTIFNNLVRQAQ